ncbi:hypothetical protein [Corynebacterium tuscaniense]|uniref:hypothetical protein n=1 Tax=Corynebacterium tuscaniense TaxID=302449 RepID=UPI00050E612A|nr:hypothetical protein [Corynebacterium tuscaniense]KAA8739206.1 anti-sigma factor [Corynebacterium tuscaniense]KGF22797.1 hypothetical protein HMPREF2129_06495 [Corynebacterium tuscaniense DNF00037]
MGDCNIEPTRAQALLCEFFDPETPQARVEEIRAIIQTCPENFARLKTEMEIRQIVRRCNCQDQAPEQLRQRIVRSISITYYK